MTNQLIEEVYSLFFGEITFSQPKHSEMCKIESSFEIISFGVANMRLTSIVMVIEFNGLPYQSDETKSEKLKDFLLHCCCESHNPIHMSH